MTPFDGISASSNTRVDYAVGCVADLKPALITKMIPHLKMTCYDAPPKDPSRQKLDEITIKEADLFFFDYHPPFPSSHRGAWYVDFAGTMCPEVTGDYLFSLSVAGTAKLYVDGDLVVDAATHQTPGGTFFGFGTGEISGSLSLEKDRSYEVKVEFGSLATSPMQSHGVDSTTGGGVRIGCAYQFDAEAEIQRAIEVAKQVDQVAIIAGLNVSTTPPGANCATLLIQQPLGRLGVRGLRP